MDWFFSAPHGDIRWRPRLPHESSVFYSFSNVPSIKEVTDEWLYMLMYMLMYTLMYMMVTSPASKR